MEITVKHEKTDECKLKIDVEIPPSEIQAEYQKIKDEILQDLSIPGFRKGKVPPALVEKRFRKTIEGKAINNILPRVYEQAIQTNNLKTFGQPTADDISEYTPGTPLHVKFSVDHAPICGLNKPKTIEITEPAVEIDDKDIELEIKRALRSKVKLEDDESACVHNEHYIKFNADFTEEEFAGEKLKDYPADMSNPSSVPLLLGEDLLGMKINSEKKIKKSFPADYHISKLAGKKISILVTIVSVKKFIYPELTDETAKEAKYENIADMKEKIKASLQSAILSRTESQLRKDILNAYRNSSTFEIPESLIEYSIQESISNLKNRFGANEQVFETFLTKQFGDKSGINNHFRETSITQIQDELILEEIIKENSIEPSEESIQKEIDGLAQYYGKPADELRKDLLKSGYYNQLRLKNQQIAAIEYVKNNFCKLKKGKKINAEQYLHQES